jgi:hypothetical protein
MGSPATGPQRRYLVDAAVDPIRWWAVSPGTSDAAAKYAARPTFRLASPAAAITFAFVPEPQATTNVPR